MLTSLTTGATSRFVMQPQLVLCSLFLGTGIVTTCASQLLIYNGAASTWSMLIPFVSYLGLVLSGLCEGCGGAEDVKPLKDEDPVEAVTRTPKGALRKGKPVINESIFIACVTALDLTGIVLINLAINYAGSGLFQVIYSSLIGWSAILSYVFLGKTINKVQLGGICLVGTGLITNTVGEQLHSGVHGPDNVFLGGVLSLLSAIVFAASYVLTEAVMSGPNAPSSRKVASRMGLYAALASGLYVAFHTVPNWDRLVWQPVIAAEGNITVIILAYGTLMLSQLIHTVAYFRILGTVGAVGTGIMSGLRAVSVFFVSAALFCSYQEAQCLTVSRFLSAVVVVCGVFVYAHGSGVKEDKSFGIIPSDDNPV